VKRFGTIGGRKSCEFAYIPFGYSNCFDIKTALAVKGHIPIEIAGRSKIPASLGAKRRQHTHHAIDDAVEQAEIFANVFEWDGKK